MLSLLFCRLSSYFAAAFLADAVGRVHGVGAAQILGVRSCRGSRARAGTGVGRVFAFVLASAAPCGRDRCRRVDAEFHGVSSK